MKSFRLKVMDSLLLLSDQERDYKKAFYEIDEENKRLKEENQRLKEEIKRLREIR